MKCPHLVGGVARWPIKIGGTLDSRQTGLFCQVVTDGWATIHSRMSEGTIKRCLTRNDLNGSGFCDLSLFGSYQAIPSHRIDHLIPSLESPLGMPFGRIETRTGYHSAYKGCF